jgi:sugar O-acyltransferase (sialic acid O-acetyltransferase NeuD family)
MKKRLLIVGAGGFGREVLAWALAVPADARDWEIGGFLDANTRALDPHPCDYRIVGDPASYEPRPEDVFVPAIANPAIKLQLCRGLRARGAVFTTLVHPSVIIGPACRIGEGCVLCARVVLTTNVTLGDFVTINVGTGCGHDTVLGDGTTISSFADVTGAVRLGEGVFLGSHAVIFPRVEVGEFAVVGAGSAVLRKVPPRATVMGVPAKQVAGFDLGELESKA